MRLNALLLSLLLVTPLAMADGADEPDDGGDADRLDERPREQEGSGNSGSGRQGSGNGSADEKPREDNRTGDDNSGSGSGSNAGAGSGNGNGNGSASRPPSDEGNETRPSPPPHSNGDPNKRDDRDGADDRDDDREDDRDDDDDQPPNRGRRVQDDERGFRTFPDQAVAKRPAVSFQTDRASTSVEQAGVSPMQMQVESVLEYRDEDGDGAYDLAEPVLQRFPLREIPAIVNASADDVRDVRYAFPAGGAVTLRFHMDGAGDEGAKFDVILDDFPFAATDTRVAVAVQVEVPGGLRFTQVAGQPALAGVAGERVPYISWVRNVTVDGVDQPVVASAHVSVDPQQATGLLFWSYPQGASIVHDPVLGVTLIPVFTLANPSAYAVAVLGGIAALAVGFEARRRFRP